MTSQKRNRHHQDGSSGSVRVRDIPPRFKRQKSSSSPTRASTAHETPSSSEDVTLTKPPKAKSSQSTSVESGSGILRDSHLYQFENELANQIKPAAEGQKPFHSAISNPTTQHSPQENDVACSQSPWENSYQANLDIQEPSHISLGTHFGYKTNSCTLSPWSSGNAVKQEAIDKLSWTPAVNNLNPNQGMHFSSDYFINNENGTPNRFMSQNNTLINWNKTNFLHEHYPVSTSPTVRISNSPLPTNASEKVKINKDSVKNSEKKMLDYTENDARTIEMLRELERVADQKETENYEFGTDRKSLVSHHLRMLMCAVDRYTEGIEDELAMASRHDEVTPPSDSGSSTPRDSPALGKTWINEQTKEVAGNQQELDTFLWSQKNNQSVRSEHVYPVRDQAAVSNQNIVPLLPISLHTSPLLGGKKESVDQEIVPWDLWSSKTFDFCDVLMNQTPWDSGSKVGKERKPLYQRHLHNF